MKKIVLVLLLAMACPSLASQAPSPIQNQTPEQYEAYFEELLKSPEYSTAHQSKKWVENKPDSSMGEKSVGRFLQWLEELLGGLRDFSLALGVAGKTILVGLLIAFFVWLFLKFSDRLPTFLDKKNKKRKSSISLSERILEQELFGGLPEHSQLYRTASALFDKGKFTACVSLLYRGVLRLHNVAYHLPINKSQTEYQCQALFANTKTASKSEQTFFVSLIELWQSLAYSQKSEQNHQATTKQVLMAFHKLYPDDFCDNLGELVDEQGVENATT